MLKFQKGLVRKTWRNSKFLFPQKGRRQDVGSNWFDNTIIQFSMHAQTVKL